MSHLARPSFLRVNAYNYWFLLRRWGLLYVLKILVAGIKAQFGGKHSEGQTHA